jgi:Lon-like ATP-dependent protease
VGKTSIATSIASALDKKFYRFSVGGLTDTAEIKGHRRTYIGAMPGKPVQALKSTGCLNPLILIDEIDKLGRSHNGDPASALLELLDPSQNSNFVDHYMDTPIDFSNVLFACTANDESTIPGPLRDRMEIIRLSGYDIREKVAIASRYLVPKALKDSGLIKDRHENSDQYQFPDDTLELLIKNYCRESGVRSLEKMIERVTRKIAFEKVGEMEKNENKLPSEEKVIVRTTDLEKFLGKPIFAEEAIYEAKDDSSHPPGIVMGLAWNPLGGSALFIETVSTPTAYSERDSGLHMVTGQLGSVMKESANIAYTYAKKFVAEGQSENKFFNSHQLHLHVPEGAISKDGPSAGIAMATSFIR